MAQTQNTYNIKLVGGMNMDQGVQSVNPNTAYKLINIKNQIEGVATLGSLINEKGTSLQEIKYNKIPDSDTTLEDIVNTSAIIAVFKCTPQTSVIYTKKQNTDNSTMNCIISLHQENELSSIEATLLAKGNFNFGNYIDAVFCYENSKIQKVYWVDGVNVLRYINIVKEKSDASYITDTFYLDSNPDIKYDHQIRVKKHFNQGLFTGGVIQYAFTYYLENGPETPIVDYTPLYYITAEGRGLKPDEVIACSFEVQIVNPDTRYDYARVYSIHRTSLNATPIVRIVKDIKIKKDG